MGKKERRGGKKERQGEISSARIKLTVREARELSSGTIIKWFGVDKLGDRGGKRKKGTQPLEITAHLFRAQHLVPESYSQLLVVHSDC